MAANQPAFDIVSNQHQSDIIMPATLQNTSSRSVSNGVYNLVNAIFMTNIFDFFGLPGELRLVIYQKLWENAVISINGRATSPVRVSEGGFPDLTITDSLQLRQHPTVIYISKPWLRISKQFFNEARYQLWQCLNVSFDRRWDLINAAMNQSLDPRNPFEMRPAPSIGIDTFTLFPFQVNFFQKIRNLHLNLSSFDDFSGVVSIPEGRRAIEYPLSRLAYFMPNIRGLLFTIDQRSKISDTDQVMLPFSWFLELVCDIINRHRWLNAVRFIHGPGYDNGIFARKNGRFCLLAMDGIFQEHVRAVRQGQGRRFDMGGVLNGGDLRRYFGWRMNEWFFVANNIDHRDARNLLAAKIAALP